MTGLGGFGFGLLFGAGYTDAFEKILGTVEGQLLVDMYPPEPVAFDVLGEGLAAGFRGGVQIELRVDAPAVVLFDVTGVL